MQSVTFQIVNGSSEDRYLVTNGTYCSPYGVKRAGDPDNLPMDPPYNCFCECAPVSPHPTGYRRLAPAGTFDLVWDARALNTCHSQMACDEYGFKFCAPITLFGAQPLAPGDYAVTIGADAQPHEDCSATGPDTYECNPYTNLDKSGPACGAILKTTVDLTLPPSGDVVVPVVLN